MVAFTPASQSARFPTTDGQIVVGPHPDRTGWSEAFSNFCGGPDVTLHIPKRVDILAMLFADFHRLIVLHRMPVEVVHAAFLGIAEYPNAIDREIEGANRCRGVPQSNGMPARL
ncbi:hypothetical protein [Methylobacterium sp. Leaf117]|uniref:hypothetical protein n=1 Tax=Methylobacterium sp. Leaf117 TaxID=1736260 RepID=UPI0007003F90|nr:hypothetical protein [Methylobacterium sp. Leaf117]KQP91547.1 hypothetical protein ASF57_23035 [Methylobacterium sp. Leaf117]